MRIFNTTSAEEKLIRLAIKETEKDDPEGALELLNWQPPKDGEVSTVWPPGLHMLLCDLWYYAKENTMTFKLPPFGDAPTKDRISIFAKLNLINEEETKYLLSPEYKIDIAIDMIAERLRKEQRRSK